MKFGDIIQGWYEKNHRQLPWRSTTDPYAIWISEVILQQTRVDQGEDYYLRFLREFPGLKALAEASEQEVLKCWQGLGYYSRARNLHRAAQEIQASGRDSLPDTYKKLLLMPGVGPYTAAAIASIAYGEAQAAVDGNVARVLARLHGVEEAVNSPAGMRIIQQLADSLMEESAGGEQGSTRESAARKGQKFSSGAGIHPGLHNQAMMEFGALVCLPRSPLCKSCPLQSYCQAYALDCVGELPRKRPSRKPLKRWLYFYVFTHENKVIIKKNGKGIWQSLYTFPVVECEQEQSETAIYDEIFLGLLHRIEDSENSQVNEPLPFERDIRLGEISESFLHQLSHRTLHARFVRVELNPLPFRLEENYMEIPLAEVERYPLPRLMERYMKIAKF